jgi:limonene-1,2-epoxide hydrolase
MKPIEVLQKFVQEFNKADADELANLYSEHAINHQVSEEPVKGREAIRKMFQNSFAEANMTCIVENMFEDGEWAIMEWRDPLGLRGCGFFHVVDSKIIFQRGYWDKLSFLRQHGLQIPKE